VNLDAALRQLGSELEFPAEPQVAARVAARISARRRRRPWLVALAAAAVALAVALAVPPARSALLRFFGLKGATIERVEERPVFEPETRRKLGVPVTLAEARRRAGFELLLPDGPAQVFYDASIPAVTFHFLDRGADLTEFRGEATPYVQKSAGPGTTVEPIQVNGRPGFWLEGERHRVVFRDARGRVLESRAAGNVLLWEQGELTLRLEGARTKAEALRIAGTLRP
jgi:hypothetical protein